MCLKCRASEAFAVKATSRRNFLRSVGGAAAGFALTPSVFAKGNKASPKPQNDVPPDAALQRLMKGNDRYVAGVTRRHDFKTEREALVGGQNPYAGILGCADSRIAPEYAFDTGRGDLFVCRVAGNFANDDTIASLEYASAILNTPLFLVLGHEACGAVSATIKSLKDNTTLPGHLPSLVSNLAPAVNATKDQPGDPLANATRRNVIDNVAKLKSATPILNAAVEQGKLKIVGGIYRLGDGKVELIG
ncbi:MAG: carbonic anhydrase [Bradyrhizobium sp.]|nr:carbonic anhydrase [Bradyrhizobium sp.]